MLRLTIRRKLVATLVITGFLPMVIMLVSVLSYGTQSRLKTVSAEFNELALASSQGISDRIESESRRLSLLARLPGTVRIFEASLPSKSVSVGGNIAASHSAHQIHSTPSVKTLLGDALSRRMRIISADNPQRFHFLAANASGQIIAADIPPAEKNVRGHAWFKHATVGTAGQVLIKAIAQDVHTRQPAVILVVPVEQPKTGAMLGVIKETIGIHTIEHQLSRGMGANESSVAIFDTRLGRSIFSIGSVKNTDKSAKLFLRGNAGNRSWLRLLLHGLVVGAAPVRFHKLTQTSGLPLLSPHWYVLVSEPATTVLAPIFDQARLIAVLGVLMIFLLFGVGILISQREVITPIKRLRVAAAAVTRGELNVRLLGDTPQDSGFRHDELGELAHDFDAMTKSLQNARHTLERREAAKSRFITIAAHELRTPIGALLGHLDLIKSRLADTTMDAAAKARLEHSLMVAISNATRLENIVNELLKLVKEDRIAQTLRWQKVNMVELVKSVCAEHTDFFQERRLKLDLRLVENINPIDGDPDKLRDALVNVVVNAIRFSPEGGIVRIAMREIVGGMLELDVEDSGPGMSQEAMGSLFEPFQPGDDVTHHSTALNDQSGFGLGLGLAIVRRFIDMHGGRVFIQKLPVGTRVRFILPIQRFEPLPSMNELIASDGL
jgi:signal transduction histidine kinase